MAQPADVHLKLLIGDLAVQLAVARADVERLKEQIAATPDDQLPTADVRPFPERSESTG
jgi:hypothetical protein